MGVDELIFGGGGESQGWNQQPWHGGRQRGWRGRPRRTNHKAEGPGETSDEFRGRDGGQRFWVAEWAGNQAANLPLGVTGDQADWKGGGQPAGSPGVIRDRE